MITGKRGGCEIVLTESDDHDSLNVICDEGYFESSQSFKGRQAS